MNENFKPHSNRKMRNYLTSDPFKQIFRGSLQINFWVHSDTWWRCSWWRYSLIIMVSLDLNFNWQKYVWSVNRSQNLPEYLNNYAYTTCSFRLHFFGTLNVTEAYMRWSCLVQTPKCQNSLQATSNTIKKAIVSEKTYAFPSFITKKQLESTERSFF